jgi:hypothetical protein
LFFFLYFQKRAKTSEILKGQHLAASVQIAQSGWLATLDAVRQSNSTVSRKLGILFIILLPSHHFVALLNFQQEQQCTTTAQVAVVEKPSVKPRNSSNPVYFLFVTSVDVVSKSICGNSPFKTILFSFQIESQHVGLACCASMSRQERPIAITIEFQHNSSSEKVNTIIDPNLSTCACISAEHILGFCPFVNGASALISLYSVPWAHKVRSLGKNVIPKGRTIVERQLDLYQSGSGNKSGKKHVTRKPTTSHSSDSDS